MNNTALWSMKHAADPMRGAMPETLQARFLICEPKKILCCSNSGKSPRAKARSHMSIDARFAFGECVAGVILRITEQVRARPFGRALGRVVVCVCCALAWIAGYSGIFEVDTYTEVLY